MPSKSRIGDACHYKFGNSQVWQPGILRFWLGYRPGSELPRALVEDKGSGDMEDVCISNISFNRNPEPPVD